MDPVSIVGLVGASMAIAARVAELVTTIPRLVTSYSETERSIRRLASQLELFQGTVTELAEWLQRSPCVSDRVKNTLNASLISCRDVIDDMEAHVRRVMPMGHDDGGPGFSGRTRHVWDETSANEWEQKVLNQMQMMDIYIRMLHLSGTAEQDSALDSKSAVTAIERSNDDAKTVRSAWGDDTVTLAASQKASPTKQANRRSVMAKLRAITLTPSSRRRLANELVAACRNRNAARIHELMSEGASPNEPARDRITPLIAAVRTGQFTIIETMLRYGAQVNLAATPPLESNPTAWYVITPLEAAIDTNSVGLVNLLIQNGASVVSRSSACRPVLFRAIESGNVDIVTALLQAGADSEIHTFGGEINSSGMDGRLPQLGTPLFLALGSGNVDMVRTLLDYGADVNQIYTNPEPAKDTLKFTPLCFVLCHHTNTKELIQLLLDRGADANQCCGHVDRDRVLRDLESVLGYNCWWSVSGVNAHGLANMRRDTHRDYIELLKPLER